MGRTRSSNSSSNLLWDNGALKVGHAHALAGGNCVRLAKQDIHLIRNRPSGGALIWRATQKLYDELRKKFWSDIATASGQDFRRGQAGRARTSAITSTAESRYLVEPNIKEGKRRLRRPADASTGSGNISIASTMRRTLVQHNVLHQRRIQDLPEGGSLPMGCARAAALPHRPRRRTFVLPTRSPNSLPSSASSTTRHATRWRISCAAYFLVAKDVGDLTRQSSALRWKCRTRSGRRHAGEHSCRGFLKAARARTTSSSWRRHRLNARADAFKRDPVNSSASFHVATPKASTSIPTRCAP